MKQNILICVVFIFGFVVLSCSDEKDTSDADTTQITFNTPESVDLGLSVKWAKYNIGAEDSCDIGDYYAWGETIIKENYSRWTYDPLGDGEMPYDDIGTDISRTKYDVAHIKWEGNWRMPTRNEMQELVDKCTWKKDNGKYIVTGPNGNSITMAYTGYMFYNDTNYRSSLGCYLTSTRDSAYDAYVYILYFQDAGYLSPSVSSSRYIGIDRSYGLSVRAVQD